MASITADAPPRETVGPKSSTSVRIPVALKGAAKEKATNDGVLLNTVITELLEGYVRGAYVLPKVSKTYESEEK